MKRILLPFGWIYNLATRLRNHLYDTGYRRSFSFAGVFTVSIGNLNMGGSGKTPVTEYLIRLLSDSFRVATLSRGYGRTTRGFKLVDDSDTADTAGDEPVQMYRKFSGKLTVAVSENRALAIPELLNLEQPPQVVILDDAFQHRKVVPDLNILLTRFSEPFFKDRMFPAGWLRESRIGAKRADIIVFTKCPDAVDPDTLSMLKENAARYAGDVPVFFTRYSYGSPVAFGSSTEFDDRIILVTGIANSAFLLAYCKTRFQVLRHIKLADHHRFSFKEIEELVRKAHTEGATLLTTEKDMVRLLSDSLKELVSASPWFYLPVEVEFLQDREEFDKIVLGSLNHKLNEPS